MAGYLYLIIISSGLHVFGAINDCYLILSDIKNMFLHQVYCENFAIEQGNIISELNEKKRFEN